VFQDPYSSLNPRIRIGEAIGEAMLQHKLCSRAELYDKVIAVMQICGLAPQHYNRFPHEFSGGQRQRIGIARALILKPGLYHCRRADLGAGCLDSGADHQSVFRSARRFRRHLFVYLP
jgi:ABC-type microcin C transport system duplicated ATPase subunit YejF